MPTIQYSAGATPRARPLNRLIELLIETRSVSKINNRDYHRDLFRPERPSYESPGRRLTVASRRPG